MLQARVSTSIYKETIWTVERFQNQAIKTSKFKREGVLDVLVKKKAIKKEKIMRLVFYVRPF